MIDSISPRYAAIVCTLACTLLVACSNDDNVITLDANPSVSIALPQMLLDSEVIVQENLRPQIRLSTGAIVHLDKAEGNSWSGIVNVTPGSAFTATISWMEWLNGRELELATLTQEMEVAADGTITRSDSAGYSTAMDEDNDGKSNFSERENQSDPFQAENQSTVNSSADAVIDQPSGPVMQTEADSTTSATTDAAINPPTDAIPVEQAAIADLVVPRIATNAVPIIDGRGVSELGPDGELLGEWAAAIQVDNSGAPLLIDKLILSPDTDEDAGSPRRRWAAAHDSQYLYVLVLVDDDGDRHRDSDKALNMDDSIELFIDGDNSKSGSYDSNDFSRIIPLQLAGADKQSATSGDLAGPNSSDAPLSLSFATGPGIGPDGLIRPRYEQDVYEIRIELKSAGINLDEPFGFELQVNDDDQGGSRNSRWAWKLPTGSPDRANDDPSLFGTLVLE
ncbi:MAG: hypothetical protein HKN42_14030 [Granulosicoccus sp.]|nr:hypothetical protein [Granulosicoccus sp.]